MAGVITESPPATVPSTAGAAPVRVADPDALLRGRLSAAVTLIAVGAATAAVVFDRGGSLDAPKLIGLDTGSPSTAWLLSALRLAMDAAATITVGCLVAAVFLVPGRIPGERARTGRPLAPGWSVPPGGRLLLGAPARGWLTGAVWAAVAWTVATAATLCLTLADLLGVPTDAIPLGDYFSFAWSVELGRVLVSITVLTTAVAVACRMVRSVNGAAATLVLAVGAVLPRAFTGHAQTSTLHDLASSALVLHVVGAMFWTGGLMALLLARGRPPRSLAASVRRFSTLALCCFGIVVLSGLVGAALRLSRWEHLFTSYGIVLGVKTVALVGLAAAGWYHRTRSLPALASGRPRVFARIAWIEALVMAAAIGLAAGLSRTPPPDGKFVSYLDKPVERILYWVPDPIALTVLVAAVGWYLAGVRRIRARELAWPVSRTAAWIAAWLVVVAATQTQFAVVGVGLFTTVETTQHLGIAIAAPLLLVAGAPVRLARLALRPSTEPNMRGPREWLDELSVGPAQRLLADPIVATALYGTGLFAAYTGASRSVSIANHATHLAILGGALAVGAWYATLVVRDGRVSRRARMAMAFAAIAMQLIVGVALTRDTAPPDLVVIVALCTIAVGLAACVALLDRAPAVDDRVPA